MSCKFLKKADKMLINTFFALITHLQSIV